MEDGIEERGTFEIEAATGVDDDVIEGLPCDGNELVDGFDGLFAVSEFAGSSQDGQLRTVRGEQRGKEPGIEAGYIAQGVAGGVFRDDAEVDGHIAEGHAEVDEKGLSDQTPERWRWRSWRRGW
jgi:hypothetical protein